MRGEDRYDKRKGGHKIETALAVLATSSAHCTHARLSAQRALPADNSESRLRLGQRVQLLPLNPQPNPLLLLASPDLRTLIKLQTRFIPIQTTPLQPLAIDLERLLCQLLEQRLAVPLIPVALLDEQILEVDARHASPGAVVVEVERHAGDGAVGVGDEECLCVAF